MGKLKIVILSSLIGAVLGFCLWPGQVVGGIGPVVNCPPNADCKNLEEKTTRIKYLLRSPSWRDKTGNFSSKKQYCQLILKCENETKTTTISIILGAAIGAGIGLLLKKSDPKSRGR